MTDRFCGNCPARREETKGAVCLVFGSLPWTDVGSGCMDMLRPDQCKAKPRNRAQWLRMRIEETNRAGEQP